MSHYSEFVSDNKKTRSQNALEEQLSEFKNYKSTAQNFSNIDGMDKKSSSFGIYNNVNDDRIPNTLFSDPRYLQNNTRDRSRKQINNIQNIKSIKNVPGYNIFDSNEKFQEYQETNYEDNKFMELNRDMELGINLPLRTFGDVNPEFINKKERRTNEIDSSKNNVDLDEILSKVKHKSSMPKKNITAETVKGKILQFKNCTPDVQNMICNELINIWEEDFKLKKITSYNGVKNFILHNFKDKMNIFFVLFDDEGDFISTFAIDTENFAPYISHLFVNPNLRNRGFGKKTLKYAEKYIKKLGFTNSYLWCEDTLINYYKKNSYIVDSPMRISEDKTVWKMSKNL